MPTSTALVPAFASELAPEPVLDGGVTRIEPSSDLDAVVAALIRRGDSPETRRAYRSDLTQFLAWLAEAGLSPAQATPDDLDRYREWLVGPRIRDNRASVRADASRVDDERDPASQPADEGGAGQDAAPDEGPRYAVATANRKLTVVRGFYAEATRRGLVALNPAAWLRKVRGRDERVGQALTRGQARELFDRITVDLEEPGRRLIALRDLALISLGLRLGLRCADLTSAHVADLEERQGHRTIAVTGKGRVSATLKVPPDVGRLLDEWIAAAALSDSDPLFIQIGKGSIWLSERRALSSRAIYRIVAIRLAQAKLPAMGPHDGLRASFITLALEGGASLHATQFAARHADPRTTERYWKRKLNLDDNAVDYIHL